MFAGIKGFAHWGDGGYTEFLQYLKELIEAVDVPLIGVGTSGSYTRETDYIEDAMVFGVLCGDLKAKVFQERVEYENIEETTEKIIQKVDGWDLAIVYSGNSYFKNPYIDSIPIVSGPSSTRLRSTRWV